MNEKTLTTKLEIEHKIISCLVNGPYDVPSFINGLCADYFSTSKYKAMFETIVKLVESGKEVGFVPMYLELTEKGSSAGYTISDLDSLENAKGHEGLDMLISILEKISVRVELDKLTRDLAHKIDDDTCEDIGHEVEQATQEMHKAIEGRMHKFTSLSDTSQALIAGLGTPYQGLPTGFKFIDENGGLPIGGLTVIGAGTSQGKSAFALCVSLEAASQGHRIAYISLEMSAKALTQRILAIKSGLSCAKIRDNVIDDIYEQGLLAEANEDIQLHLGDNFFFEESNVSSLDQIKQSIRALYHTKKIDVAVIDYLQIMTIQNARSFVNIEQQLALAARELHNLAKDCGISILAISQLNRDRENEEPQLSRLRDSAQIADAADAVILIYRPEVYGKYYSGRFRNTTTQNTALIKVAKMRQGATGDFVCNFDPQYTRFYDRNETNPTFQGFQ